VSRGLRAFQPYLENALPREIGGDTWLCGLVGDHPSHYSRSPAIWNSAFRALDVDALYVPFDVTQSDLAGLIAEFRL
jgi:shikimate 5-dehydrogenase